MDAAAHVRPAGEALDTQEDPDGQRAGPGDAPPGSDTGSQATSEHKIFRSVTLPCGPDLQ